jgi:hypothetical protein
MVKRKRIFGEDHPGTLNSIVDVAAFLEDQREYDRALQLCREILEK